MSSCSMKQVHPLVALPDWVPVQPQYRTFRTGSEGCAVPPVRRNAAPRFSHILPMLLPLRVMSRGVSASASFEGSIAADFACPHLSV